MHNSVCVTRLEKGKETKKLTSSNLCFVDLDRANLEKRIPLGRFGTREEVAHAALFLAQNKYAHNCVLNLDGGLSAV